MLVLAYHVYYTYYICLCLLIVFATRITDACACLSCMLHVLQVLVDHVYYTYYRCLWLLIVYATDTHYCTCCRCFWLLIVYATDTHRYTCCRCLWLLIMFTTRITDACVHDRVCYRHPLLHVLQMFVVADRAGYGGVAGLHPLLPLHALQVLPVHHRYRNELSGLPASSGHHFLPP